MGDADWMNDPMWAEHEPTSFDYDKAWEIRRPWVTRGGTIYIGDPGTHHPDLCTKYNLPKSADQYNPEHDEIGDILNGIATNEMGDIMPNVQRFYQKHFKAEDTPTLSRLRSPKLAADIAPQRWAYLNGEVEFGSHYPQLVMNLGKAQGLQDGNKLSNLIAAGQWPITEEKLALGELRHGLVQIENANLQRDSVQEAVEAALDKRAGTSYSAPDDLF